MIYIFIGTDVCFLSVYQFKCPATPQHASWGKGQELEAHYKVKLWASFSHRARIKSMMMGNYISQFQTLSESNGSGRQMLQI